MSDGDVKFVMEQSVKDCSIEYEDSGDSGDESNENTDSPDGTDAPDTTDATDNGEDRRRLIDDIVHSVDEDVDEDVEVEDDEDSSTSIEVGVSSDDSREYENGLAQFIISGTANDVCMDSADTEVDYYMVDQPDESLQIVFSRFECSLQVDPWFKIDKSKIDEEILGREDGANVIQNIGVIVFITVISLFLF
eukprot:UN06283